MFQTSPIWRTLCISITVCSLESKSSQQPSSQQQTAQPSLPTSIFYIHSTIFLRSNTTTTFKMQFTISTIVAIFAASAMAAPSAAAGSTTGMVVRDTSAVNALQAQAQAFIEAKEAAGCSKLSKI
jgi:hypothetical protein